ncbi:LysR family transcriptional regulator [Nocardia sp. NBC_01327]|uniref:LysR family transcriptional regulator n=1 Tax=Nocardia sp. NBC_01327 TaxID=2903593 RepID=UPI002E0D545A|nr:LysR family transcriptional regulator [Nocardia sp. NBC_01327]
MPARPDLNLLVALQALLEERHVSRAAERIGVTQPAASAMLARLRRHFGDQLLERMGSRYELTPLAVQLRDQVGGIMQLSDRLFETTAQFDPATSEREFILTASDYAVAVLGPELVSEFETHAPHATFRFRQFGIHREGHPDTTARSEDGVILPHSAYPLGLSNLELFSDEWVAVVDRTNPVIEHTPGLHELRGLRWVLAQHEPHEPPFMVRRLAELGVDLRPQVVTDSFLALPLYIAGTDRIGIVQHRLLHAIALPPALRIIPCPFEVGPINEALWWHPVHTHDPGHKWFRRTVLEAAARVAAVTPIIEE